MVDFLKLVTYCTGQKSLSYCKKYLLVSDVSIGFEETEMEVYEYAGSVSPCVAILRPLNLNRIEYANFSMRVSTRNISG